MLPHRVTLGQAILVASAAAPALLQRVWAEMEYRLDAYCVTKGGHIQQSWGMPRNFVLLSVCSSHVTVLSKFKCTDFLKCVGESWLSSSFGATAVARGLVSSEL